MGSNSCDKMKYNKKWQMNWFVWDMVLNNSDFDEMGVIVNEPGRGTGI